MKLVQHLHKYCFKNHLRVESTKTDHDNLHKCSIYCRADVLDCIRFYRFHDIVSTPYIFIYWATWATRATGVCLTVDCADQTLLRLYLKSLKYM